MIKISHIVFDFGCVISLKQNEERIEEICGVLNITKDQYKSVYQRSRNDYDAAIITAAEFWRNCMAALGIERQISDPDLRKIVKSDSTGWLDINSDTIRLIESLHGRGYELAILSNMTFDALAYLRHADWMKHFETRVFSCEEKVSKPNEKIYEILLSRLSVPPEKVLFIDDSIDNIAAARRIGINTIRYEGHDLLMKELESRYAITL